MGSFIIFNLCFVWLLFIKVIGMMLGLFFESSCLIIRVLFEFVLIISVWDEVLWFFLMFFFNILDKIWVFLIDKS